MKKVLALALVFALITGFLFLAYLKTLDKQPEAVQTEDVVVAAVEIPAYTRITEEMLTVKKLPLGGATEGCARTVQAVVGLVADSPLLPGEQILPAKLKTMGDSRDGLSYAIPEGYRAYTLSVDEVSSLGWYIKKNDTVDVICDLADLPIDNEFVTSGHAVVLVAEGCKVLETGSAKAAGAEDAGAVSFSTLTLLVTPEQAQRLLYASSEGSLRYLLRGVDDETQLGLDPIRLEDIVAF